MSYFDTTHQEAEQLKEYKLKAGSQDKIIAEYFRDNPGKLITPWEVLRYAKLKPDTPITSVRRSMNTLTNAGILEKTGFKQVGRFARESYCWRLADKNFRQGQLF